MLSATARRSIHQEGCVVRGRPAGKTSTTLAVLLHPTICSTCSRSGLGRSDSSPAATGNGRKRRILVVATHCGEGPFTIRLADLRHVAGRYWINTHVRLRDQFTRAEGN